MRFVGLITGAVMLAIGALAYYERYYRWRDCFNELGRCYDSATSTVYLEQAGIAWGLIAIVGGVLTLISLRSILRTRSAKRKTPR